MGDDEIEWYVHCTGTSLHYCTRITLFKLILILGNFENLWPQTVKLLALVANTVRNPIYSACMFFQMYVFAQICYQHVILPNCLNHLCSCHGLKVAFLLPGGQFCQTKPNIPIYFKAPKICSKFIIKNVSFWLCYII